jgi:predicted O-methyltransferase YrrM
MDFKFQGIRHNFPGMLTEAEGEFLAEMCKGKFVIELGSYTGMSTISIARVARHVVSCDWHGGDAHIGQQDTLALLDGNLKRYGVRDKVTMLVGKFDVTLPLLACQQFDVAYIDGAHDYESVKHDTEAVLPLLKKSQDSRIIWHDHDMTGVAEFLQSFPAVVEIGPDRMASSTIF